VAFRGRFRVLRWVATGSPPKHFSTATWHPRLRPMIEVNQVHFLPRTVGYRFVSSQWVVGGDDSSQSARTRIGVDIWSLRLSVERFSNMSLPKRDTPHPVHHHTSWSLAGASLAEPSSSREWPDMDEEPEGGTFSLELSGHPIGAPCPPARFRSLLAIERVALAEMLEETSMARTDTRSQRSRLSLCLWRRALERASDERLARPG